MDKKKKEAITPFYMKISCAASCCLTDLFFSTVMWLEC